LRHKDWQIETNENADPCERNSGYQNPFHRLVTTLVFLSLVHASKAVLAFGKKEQRHHDGDDGNA
jgi:hypothetical protein